MLAPDGRAVLTELLRPPPGMDLARGVATTFSLDLVAALRAPLAFASHRLGSRQDQLAVLQAVTMATGHLDIFCQAGQLAVPGRYYPMLAWLEEMVHPARSPHPGGLFHPKIWLLEFSDGARSSFRFLCSSRDLTSSRGWDTVLRLDGVRGPAPIAANRPLRDLVLSLPSWAIHPLPADRAARIEGLASAVRYVQWEEPDGVDEIIFHALGVPDRRSSLDFGGTAHLLISPFVTDDGIREIAPPGSPSVQVVSRVEDLERLQPQTLGQLAGTFVLDDAAALDHADSAVGALAGLHTKTYVIERGNTARLFLGSANATGAAFDGNIEFLTELTGPASKLGIGTLLGPEAPFRKLLVDYRALGQDKVAAEEDADRRLRAALRAAAALPLRATVEPDGGLYTVRVTSSEPLRPGAGLSASLGLLTLPGVWVRLSGAVDVSFTELDLASVTPFLVVRVTDGRDESGAMVAVAALDADPPGRLDELLARQVGTPEKFLRLLALLMSLGAGGAAAELLGASGAAPAGDSHHAGQLGVFESLVQTLGSTPAVLADIAPLVERLKRSEKGRKMLPPGFAELWDLVWAARGELAEAELGGGGDGADGLGDTGVMAAIS